MRYNMEPSTAARKVQMKTKTPSDPPQRKLADFLCFAVYSANIPSPSSCWCSPRQWPEHGSHPAPAFPDPVCHTPS